MSGVATASVLPIRSAFFSPPWNRNRYPSSVVAGCQHQHSAGQQAEQDGA